MEHLKEFTDHLQRQLSFADFQNLPTYLGIKPYRLTTLVKGKEDWYLGEICKLAELLKEDPLDLIQKWNLGWKYITLHDLQPLLDERGLSISFVGEAA